VTFREVGNVPRAWPKGAEFALSWHTSTRITLRAGLVLLKTRITNTPDPTDPLLGKEFQRSPHLTASFGVDWRPADGWEVDVDFSHRGGYFSDDTGSLAERVGPATVFNLRASRRMGSLRLFGFVRNVFDNFYLNSLNRVGDPLATAGEPREFGIGIEAVI
jgi:outer membrane receptor protein involved in Fe transport